MLTRYEELYNKLTHSTAYTEKGYDASKVNKNTFTPHSLKALLIGFNCAVGIYYTTGGNVSNNVMMYKFSNHPRNEEDWKQLLNGKTMVSTLYSHLMFQNVEEVFIYKGYTEEQQAYGNLISQYMQKEINELNTFIINPMLKAKFNRFSKGIIVNDNLSEDIAAKISSDFGQNKIPEGFKSIEKFNYHFRRISELSLFANCDKKKAQTYKVDELGFLSPSTALESMNSNDYLLDSRPKESETITNENKKNYALYNFFKDEEKYLEELKKVLKQQKEEKKKEDNNSPNNQTNTSRGYVTALLKQGYKIVNNNNEFFGKQHMANKIMKWLQSVCTEKPDNSTGYKYKTCYMHADFLSEKGVKNTKDANIWNSDIYTKSPDLEFRVFIKENKYGIDVLIKLPIGLNEFEFTNQSNESIALLLSNTNPEKGKTFQSSIMESPQIKSLSETHGIDCIYEAIEFSLSKNLAEFAKSSWLFLDYLRACNGETNVFSNFRDLPLGEKIVIGVKTNSLKTERFDCSGQNQTSGLICGQAGSGKSALMDSLVLQFLALKGDYGNGAVVLMDAKQEWPPLWRAAFENIGVPFYGFDGTYLTNQDKLKKREISQSGKVSIVNFKESITQEVGGMMLMMALYNVIQKILKESGCKDVKTFNKSNKNYNGITRLPRIAIFIDEMNTFAVNAQKGSAAQGIMPVITGGANLTRTAGYMWFLCGQDVPRKILPSEQRGSFKYNVMGTMDKERYEYFDVDENPNVVAYESKAATSDNPHPIMKQGTFYAGVKGKTELIRSLYLPDEEKETALNLLNSSFEGMKELDALVRYALQNNMFDAFTQGVGGLNNIIFGTLRDIGVISDAEFDEATARIFGEQMSGENSEASDASDDYWNVGNDIIVDDTNNTPQNNQDRPHRQNQPNNTPSSTTPQPQRQQGSSTQPITSQPQNNTQQQARQNDRNTVSDRNYYRGRIEVNDNPFTKYTNNTNIDTMLTVKDMTKILMDDIRKNVCPDEMITSFMIADGTLFINEIIYEPSFDNAFMNSLPQSLRIKVENGQMAEFFDLRRIYHYKNLEKFGLMDETLAQGRARKEMGIGFRKRWSVLFKKFKRLQLIQVGQIKYFRENPDTNEEQGFLDRFKNNPATTYSSGIGSGFMDKVWDSRPVRVLTGAMGWTVGVQATWFLASIMGPWGLLFGAFAMAGAMKEIKNSRNNNYSNNQASYQSQSYNQQYQGKSKTTQKKKNNKTNWND